MSTEGMTKPELVAAFMERRVYPPAEQFRQRLEAALKNECGDAVIEVVILGSSLGNWSIRQHFNPDVPPIGDVDYGIIFDASNLNMDSITFRGFSLAISMIIAKQIDLSICYECNSQSSYFEVSKHQGEGSLVYFMKDPRREAILSNLIKAGDPPNMTLTRLKTRLSPKHIKPNYLETDMSHCHKAVDRITMFLNMRREAREAAVMTSPQTR